MLTFFDGYSFSKHFIFKHFGLFLTKNTLLWVGYVDSWPIISLILNIPGLNEKSKFILPSTTKSNLHSRVGFEEKFVKTMNLKNITSKWVVSCLKHSTHSHIPMSDIRGHFWVNLSFEIQLSPSASFIEIVFCCYNFLNFL